MAYVGKKNARVTARCARCGTVTVKELDYRAVTVGATAVNVLDAFNCRACGRVVFTEAREVPADVASTAAVEKGQP